MLVFHSYLNLPEGRFYQPETITNHSEMKVMFTKGANELGHHLHRNVAHLKNVSKTSIFLGGVGVTEAASCNRFQKYSRWQSDISVA